MPFAPPMQARQGPAGPASPPTGNPGLNAAALAQVREAITILEKALPNLQIGSDPHKAVIDSIGKLAKAIPATEAMPGIQTSTLLSLLRDSQQGAPMKALMGGAAGPGGGQPGGGGGPAAMMGGGAPPPGM